MAAITSRFFQSFEDRTLLLANEEWCRRLSFANAWTRIRIGALVSVNSGTTSNVTDCTLFFGLCSGKTAPASANLATNFLGASLVGSPVPLSTRTLTYAAGVNPYYTATLGHVFRRISQTITSAVFSSGLAVALAWTGTQRRRSPIIIDLLRPNNFVGAVTINVYAPSAATVLFDYRPDHLLDGLDQLGTPVINGQTMTVLASSSAVSSSEAEGALETLCLYWGRATYPLEVYAVGACLVADV